MPRVIDNYDFRGGYATDLPPERMEANMVLKAENLYWKDGLVSRGGKSQYSTLSTYATVVRGIHRAYLNGAWQYVGAFDNGTDVEIWRSSGTTWNAVSTAIKFQTSYAVQMDQLNTNLIIVNGYDRPHVLYVSTGSTYTLTSLDRHDEREISTFDWTAGERYTTGTTEYVDQSTEAYSTVAADFPISPTTFTSDGHYIASDYPFTKVVYSSVTNLTTVAVAAYHYWTSTGWKVMTSVLELSPQWTTSTGRSTAVADRTMEIPYLTDWIQVNTTSMGENLQNKFAARVTFPTAPTTVGNAQKVTPTDIHYLTRIMADDRPAKVRVHNNRVYMSAGNNVQISPYNQVTGWDEFSVEYFQDGGMQIEQMVSYQDYLLVVKPAALYGFFGNSYENWTKRKLSNIGSNWGDSVAIIGEIVAFLSRDGVRLWNGTENVLVTKHVWNDLSQLSSELMDRGDCESTVAPCVAGETASAPTNATWARSAAQAYAGTNSFLGTKTTASGAGQSSIWLVNTSLSMHNVKPGQTLSISARVYIPSGGMLGSELSIFHDETADGVNYTLASHAANAASTFDAFQLVTMTSFTMSSSAKGWRLRFLINTVADLNEIFYADNISVLVNGIPLQVNAIAYNGMYLLSYPRAEVVALADPDTFRRDDMGDGRISWWKWTGIRADKFLWNNGADDDGRLVGTANKTAPILMWADNGNNIDETTTPIAVDFKSKYGSNGTPQTKKRYFRMKPDISGPGAWTALLSANDGSTLTTDISISLGTTTFGVGTSTWSVTQHYSTDLSVPYQMDGKNLALELQTQTTNPVKIYGYSADVETRRY